MSESQQSKQQDQEEGQEVSSNKRPQHIEGYNFEYLDHTADIQIHSWGNTLKEAFEYSAIGMMNYMSGVEYVDVDESKTTEVIVEGADTEKLLFNFLDEVLFTFHTENIVMNYIEITDFDEVNCKIVAQCYGEEFDYQKHEKGTEIKAITYSAMQIIEKKDEFDIFVIVDI